MKELFKKIAFLFSWGTAIAVSLVLFAISKSAAHFVFEMYIAGVAAMLYAVHKF